MNKIGKVLPHRPMTKITNQHNVRWSDGIYTRLMAMRLSWRMSLMTGGAIVKDYAVYNEDGSAVLIQLDHTDGKIDFIHTAETVMVDGVHVNRGFHWEASDTPDDILKMTPKGCDRYLTKSGRYHYDLVNLEGVVASHPDTFKVPSFDQLASLVKSDHVQLHFQFNGQVERMWVLFDGYTTDYNLTGTLANDPADNPYVEHGDKISFFAHHVSKILKANKILK